MVKIDFLAWETEAWLEGTRDFLQVLKRAIPEASDKEAAALSKFAAEHDMDSAEYFSELRSLEHKFQTWLPRVSAYSLVFLLQSLVETQLLEYAKRLKRTRNLQLSVADLRNQGVEASKAYITKVAGVDIAEDVGWQQLRNLQNLRNVVVHRRGRRGEADEQQRTVQQLLEQYPAGLSMSDVGQPAEHELSISFDLCEHFMQEIEAFFQRLCLAAGFQERGWKS